MSQNPKNPAKTLPNEDALIARSQNGDKDAYRELVLGYQDRVYGLVLSMVRNADHAEDVAQEVFVKAYFALNRFKGDSAFYTWLYRIASNACLDHLRRYKHAAVSLDQPLSEDEEGSRLDALQAPHNDRPEAGLEGDPNQLLQLINPDQRLILNLRETEGYSYEEIAEIMDCQVNTVKSRINRAREALKKAYLETYGERNIPDLKIVEKSEEIT